MLLNFPVPKRVAGRFVWTQRRLFGSEQPETHIVAWIRQSLRPGDTFFDIGAHYGWTAIVAADCVRRFGRVVAFEASPALVDVLGYHKRWNRLKCTDIVPKAVSNASQDNVPLFLVNGGLSYRNSLTTEAEDVPYLSPDAKSKIYVPSISLDNFCLESGLIPDVIKIDVEGAELFVLDGAKRTISAFSPILIVGVHPYWLPKSQLPLDVLAFLYRSSYRIIDQHVVGFDSSYLADYLCVHDSSINSGTMSSIPS